MQLPKLPKKKGGTVNSLFDILGDGDKRLIGVILIVLIRENADKGLILALLYILFS